MWKHLPDVKSKSHQSRRCLSKPESATARRFICRPRSRSLAILNLIFDSTTFWQRMPPGKLSLVPTTKVQTNSAPPLPQSPRLTIRKKRLSATLSAWMAISPRHQRRKTPSQLPPLHEAFPLVGSLPALPRTKNSRPAPAVPPVDFDFASVLRLFPDPPLARRI